MIDPRPGPSRDEKAPRAGPGQCKVCEGPATGYHYSIPACPACKTFFRRVVINQRRYLCIDNERSTARTRPLGHLRVCKKCRFDRCVDVGMDPIAIFSSTEASSTNSIVRYILNRQRRSSSDGSSDMSGCPESGFVEQPRVIEVDIQSIIVRMLHIDKIYNKIRRSNYQPSLDALTTLETMVHGPSKFGYAYEEMPGWPLKWDQLLNENRTSLADCIKTLSPFPAKIAHPSKQWHIADPAYAVEFTKTFQFFWNLDQKDKVMLCKHASLMVAHLTQAFYSFERGSKCTEFPDGYKPHGGRIPETSESDKLIYTKAIGILADLQMDRAEYVLLKAIVTCNPAFFGLSPSASAILSKEREKYSKSLLSYTLARRSVEEGPSAFVSMMTFISTLENICAKIREIMHALLALGIFSEATMMPFKMDLV